MKKYLLFATVTCAIAVSVSLINKDVGPMLEAQAAPSQVANDNVEYVVTMAKTRNIQNLVKLTGLLVWIAFAMAFAWLHGGKKRQPDAHRSAMIMAALAIFAMFPACGEYRVDPIVEIETNETAYVIPLEAENQESQMKFESVEYLEKKKVAVKRITIPQKKRSTGRAWFSYEWIPTVRVIEVNRSPISVKYVDSAASKVVKNISSLGAIKVESADSIGFSVGVNVSAFIDEDDTSKYLYFYRNRALSDVMDTNIRAEIQTKLSAEFGNRTLELCKSQKNEVVESVRTEIVPFFEEYGITITTFGLADGLTYEDKEIQDSINDAYVKEMGIVAARQDKEAQAEKNEMNLSIAVNEREQAEAFAAAAEERKKMVEVEVMKIKAEALKIAAEKWDGSPPKFISTSGSGGSGGSDPFKFLMPAE